MRPVPDVVNLLQKNIGKSIDGAHIAGRHYEILL